jgi:D-glycero-D-manno-heptose 1,7-bisphosphate phosphatase
MKNPSAERPKSRSIPDKIIENNPNTKEGSKAGNRAVFLDRDGTINVERGYLIDLAEVELIPTSGKAIHVLNQLNIPVIVITNQAAIDKKLLSLEQFERINDKLWNDLKGIGAHYDGLYYCPHSPEITPGCFCRKPQPGLVLQAAKDFDIDLSVSFMIGDKLTDIEAGHLSGCKTILLLSGHGEKAHKDLENYHGIPPDFICQNLGEAVNWLLTFILNASP